MEISQFIDAWDLGDIAISTLEDRDGWYLIEAQSHQYILKIYSEAYRNLEHIIQGLELQAYVSSFGLVASKILPTRSEQLFHRTSDAIASIEVSLNRRKDKISEVDWRNFGRVVAQLHTIPVSPNVKPSRLEPQVTKFTSIDAVEQNMHSLRPSSRNIVETLINRVAKEMPLDRCNRVLIHSDLCWANIVCTPDNSLVMIDFEGGGTAPAVMEFPEVTTQLCTGPSGSGPLNIAAAKAFFDGYYSGQGSDDIDIDLLTYAHAFHQLYFLADALTRGDHSFVDRMDHRLQTWDDGILNELDAVMQSARDS